MTELKNGFLIKGTFHDITWIMNSPTAWNINDKSDYLSINSDGLGLNYTGKAIWYFMLLYGANSLVAFNNY